jgi:hypothetical protein
MAIAAMIMWVVLGRGNVSLHRHILWTTGCGYVDSSKTYVKSSAHVKVNLSWVEFTCHNKAIDYVLQAEAR